MVTVIDESTRLTTTLEPFLLGRPVAIAINVDTNRIYVVSQGGKLAVIDGANDSLVTNVPLPGPPGAVAVDPVRNRVYVSLPSLNAVAVMDGATNTLIQQPLPTGGTGSTAVAVNPVTHRVYVANRGSNSVTIIDGDAFAVMTTVGVGSAPSTISVNPATNKIYVLNYFSQYLSVIDGSDNTVKSIELSRVPNSLALNPVTNRVYVSAIFGFLMVIDGDTDAVLTSVKTGSLDVYPVAVNVLTNQVFVGEEFVGTVWIVDGATNAIVGKDTDGHPYTRALAINPVTNRLVVAGTAQSSVSIVDVNAIALKNAPGTTIPIPAGSVTPYSRAVASNPITNRTYVANGNLVTVINGSTNTVTNVQLTGIARAIVVNPVTNKIYVATRSSDTVTVIDGATEVPTPLAVGSSPSDLAISTVMNRVFVANEGSSTVSVIDGVTQSVSAPLAVQTGPVAVVVNEATHRVYTANRAGQSVSVIDGLTQTWLTHVPLSGVSPVALALNRGLSKLYVLSAGSPARVTVVDTVSHSTSPILLNGTGATQIAVDPVGNLVYAVSEEAGAPVTGKLDVIDAVSGTLRGTWTLAGRPGALAVNPVLGTAYVATSSGDLVTRLARRATVGSEIAIPGPEQPRGIGINPFTNTAYVAGTESVLVVPEHAARGVPISTTVTPLPGNVTSSTTPTFTLNATSSFSPVTPPIRNVYYQFETWSGPWLKASPGAGGWTVQPPSALARGVHVLYAFASDGQDTTGNKIEDGSSPVIGSIASYLFVAGATRIAVTSVSPSLGPAIGGTEITINGSNFGQGATVTVGMSSANVTMVSSNTIVATTGASSGGLKSVTVTHPTAGSDSLPNAFTYCAYTLNPPSAIFGPGGGMGTFNVTTSPGCQWSVASNTTFVGANEGQVFTNSQTVFYFVQQGGQQRSGDILVSAPGFPEPFKFTVTQNGCTYSVAPATRQIPGGTGADSAVKVTTSSGCAWTASSEEPWLMPVSPGSGPGSVSFTFAANPAATPRTGHVIVRGALGLQVADVTVTQSGISSTIAGGNKPSLSGTGRYLAFQSADPLVAAGDTNGVSDVFVRDRATGATKRVSVTSDGGEAHGASLSPVISASGRFVVFESDASDLVSGDTNGVRDVFLHDRDADGNGVYDEPGGVTTEMVSRSAGGAPGRGMSTGGTISPDGRFVAFASDAPNLVYADSNERRDIFVRDRQQPEGLQLTRENLSSDELQTTEGASESPSISADGRWVAFDSDSSTLVTGDANGQRDVFVRDRTAGTTVRVSVPEGGGEAAGPSFSADHGAGRRLGDIHIVGVVGGSRPERLARHLPQKQTGGTLTRLSPGSGGTDSNGASVGAAVSGDGGLVVFTSTATNLATSGPPDTNTVDDVYLRNTVNGETRLVSVQAPKARLERSFDAAISGDGRTIAFGTEAASSALATWREVSGSATVWAAANAPGSIRVISAPPVVSNVSPPSGPPDATTRVQIRGTNLNDITQSSLARTKEPI